MLRLASRLVLLAAAILTASLAQAQAPTGPLSQARGYPVGVAVDDLILFAGGEDATVPANSDVVDIYDATTDSWTVEHLSVARSRLAGTAVGHLALFAGGGIDSQTPLDVVDIYDAQTKTWKTPAQLSQKRAHLVATTVGSKAIFAGGTTYDPVSGQTVASDVVDIYDAQKGTWSATTLSQPRFWIAAATAGSHAIFAGGADPAPPGAPFDTVDIYDDSTGLWHVGAPLSQARYGPAAAAVGTRAWFAGGVAAGPVASDVIDVYDAQTGTWLPPGTLPEARFGLQAAALGNTLIFAGGADGTYALTKVVHKLNVGTAHWDSTSQLVQERYNAGVATVAGKALFAGGLIEIQQPATPTDTIEVFEPVGLNYCAATQNSTGCAATIGASGSASLAANDLTLITVCVPDGVFLYFHGAQQLQTPFGNGFRCVGTNIVRIVPAGLASGGTAQVSVDLPSALITSPGVRNFQCWFRDPAAGGAGFDTSDALEITFVP